MKAKLIFDHEISGLSASIEDHFGLMEPPLGSLELGDDMDFEKELSAFARAIAARTNFQGVAMHTDEDNGFFMNVDDMLENVDEEFGEVTVFIEPYTEVQQAFDGDNLAEQFRQFLLDCSGGGYVISYAPDLITVVDGAGEVKKYDHFSEVELSGPCVVTATYLRADCQQEEEYFDSIDHDKIRGFVLRGTASLQEFLDGDESKIVTLKVEMEGACGTEDEYSELEVKLEREFDVGKVIDAIRGMIQIQTDSE